MSPSITHGSEQSLIASVDTQVEYNDNIFLTSQPHEATKGIIVTPALSGAIKEENWDAKLNAKIKSQNYSDDNIDSTDQYFDLIGRYTLERNIFSLNVNHDLASNINSSSTDFGVVGRRINTKNQSVTPQYTWLMTERSVLSLSYTYRDVDFLEAENTGFTPYVTQSGVGSLVYDLTETNKLTINFTAVDYASQNELVIYQLFMSRIGVEHKFSEKLSSNFLVGISRRNSTNKQDRSFDFDGEPIIVTQEVDAKNRGLVLNADVTQLLEGGQIVGSISRDNNANSFGGLDQVDRVKINYTDALSELWRYNISGRYEDISSISSGTRGTDRRLLFLELGMSYAIARNWDANTSYRYISRRFNNDTSESRAPRSNRIYVGLTYNFPPLSTF